MEKSLYLQLCEKMVSAMENHFAQRQQIAYFCFALLKGLTNKLNFSPSSIKIYNDYERSEQFHLFEGKSPSESAVYYSIVHDLGENSFKMLFSITFSKPYNSPSKLSKAQDEVLIGPVISRENGGTYQVSTPGIDKTFHITDYNNIQEMDGLVSSILEKINSIYSNNII